MAVRVCYKLILGVFIYRPLHDNSVKWPDTALSGEREPQRLLFFKFLFQIYRCDQDLVS